MYYRNNKQRNKSSRKKVSSRIDPKNLVKKAIKTEEEKFVSSITFEEFSLHALLNKNIKSKGYKSPTEIQERSIPVLINGSDLIGIAATGTGKTGAFLIPIIQQMLENEHTRALVVVPTRELAEQVQEEFRSLTKGSGIHSSCFIGGTSVGRDLSEARRKNRFIVATPGRLNDLINRGSIKLSNSNILVLDEFDRMLDMGFIGDVRNIASEMSDRSQTILFSATVDKSQEALIREFVSNPIKINVNTGTNSSDNVHQDIIKVKSSENKFDVLIELLKGDSFEKVILFAETKRSADKIGLQLKRSGMRSDVIHGDKSQNYRSNAIKHFKSGKTKILVATDVASRGIDVDNVTHVVNYELPRTMDSYIHRIGRTGRAGKVGMAYTFVN